MDLITCNNFKNVEPGLMMNLKTDGKNIITEFEINKSNLKSSSKQNVKQKKNKKITTSTNNNIKTVKNISNNNLKKSINKSCSKYNNTEEKQIKKIESDDIIKKRERNKYAARKCREKKKLIIENLQKDLEEKNNYIQKLENHLKDFINNFEKIFKQIFKELKKDN